MSSLLNRLPVLLGNTLLVSSLTTLLAGLLGVCLGLALFRTAGPFRGFYRGLLAAALLIPLHITVTAWYALLLESPWQPPEVVSAALLMAPAYAPLMAWATALALAMVDPEREQAALLDAGWGRVLGCVTLPEARPVIGAGLLFTFILASNEVTATDVLRVRTFAEETFTQFSLQQADQAVGVAVVLVLLGAGLTLLLARVVGDIGEISIDGLYRRFSHSVNAPAGKLATWGPPLLLLLLLGVPLFYLVWSVESFTYFITAARTVRDELLYTLLVGGISAIALALISATLAGALAAWRGSAAAAWRKLWLLALALWALAPAPVVGYAIIVLFNRPGLLGYLYDSPAIIIITHLMRFLPLATLLAYPFMARLPEELRDAGKLDGAGRLRFAGSVVAPLCWPVVAALFLISFALVVGEIGATALVAPPGTTMLGIRIFTLLHWGIYPDVAGAALILILPMAALGYGAFALAGRLMQRQ